MHIKPINTLFNHSLNIQSVVNNYSLVTHSHVSLYNTVSDHHHNPLVISHEFHFVYNNYRPYNYLHV